MNIDRLAFKIANGDEKAFEYIEKHYGKEIVEELKRIV